MTPKEVLTEARCLLAEPDRWIAKRRMAEAEDGREVTFDSPDAFRFCMLGAMLRVAPSHADYALARNVVAEQIGDQMVGIWNDRHTHGDVLDLLDRSIAAAPPSRD